MRLHRTSNGGVALQPSKYTRHDRVSVACLIQRLNSKSSMLTELFFDVSNTKSSLAVAEKRIQKLESKMESGLRHDNAPKFLKHFIQALQMGILPPQAMQDIMEDMGASLMMHKAKRNQTSRSLYITLLNNGSPWICSLVSKALGGPHIRTIKSWRGTDSFHFKPGLRVENMQQLVQILNAFGLLDVPGIWSEDATTCLKRLAVSLDYEPGEVYIEGFINPVRVRCIDDFKKACADYGPSGLATYVYVWTWIPLIPHAPYFPVFWIASNNRFNAAQVWSWWMWLFQEGQKAGIKCTGDVSDGDARLRRTQYEANKHNKLQTATRTINHPLIFMHISYIFEQPMLMHQDWMHLSGFRIRRLLLDGVHNFHLGDGANAGGEYLRKLVGTHLSAKDVDHKEKQHWSGCLKIFSTETLEHLERLRAEGDQHVRGVVAYIKFGIKLLNCHIGTEAGAEATNRKQAVVDSAFCCAFVLYWRWRIGVKLAGSGFCLKKHFLTRETFLDVLTITQARILLVVVYREHFPELKIHGPNISSRFSEYVFQYCRCTRQTAQTLMLPASGGTSNT